MMRAGVVVPIQNSHKATLRRLSVLTEPFSWVTAVTFETDKSQVIPAALLTTWEAVMIYIGFLNLHFVSDVMIQYTFRIKLVFVL
jgi:hypothetical protein